MNAELHKVLKKIKKYQIEGETFDELEYGLGWDDDASPKENMRSTREEAQALKMLGSMGVVSVRVEDNFYWAQDLDFRGRYPDAPPEVSCWSDWLTEYSGAQRNYPYLYYLDGFDYSKFKDAANMLGLQDSGLELVSLSEQRSTNDPASIAIRVKPVPSYSDGLLRYNGNRNYEFEGVDIFTFEVLWDSRLNIVDGSEQEGMDPVPWEDLKDAPAVLRKTISARVAHLRGTLEAARLPISIESKKRFGTYQMVLNLVTK